MTKLAVPILLLAVVGTTAAAARGDASVPDGVRFETLEIYVDAGSHPLAAWQFEFRVAAGDAEVVGVEGGEPPAFAEAPYYDPSALRGGYLIVAAFQANDEVPTGRTRVATLHLMVRGDREPRYDVSLVVASDPDGNSYDAVLSVEKGDDR